MGDISDYVIKKMKAKHANPKDGKSYCPEMTWCVDDSTKSKFSDASFPQIVDKSLVDCMCHCDEPEFKGCIGRLLQECFRILKPSGVMVVATRQHMSKLY